MKAIITVGVSGSGKSTWALRELDFININRDDMRWEISGKFGWNGPRAYTFNSKIEKHVTARNNDRMVLAAVAGKNLIVSDTNLNPQRRKELIEFLTFLGYEVEIKEFPITYQEALRRDPTRGIFAVGEKVLYKQWQMWVQYWNDKEKENQ